jgi:hypothetical protein
VKSLPTNAGNVKMRGKRTKAMRCGCCVATDLRPQELKRMHEKEMTHPRIGCTADRGLKKLCGGKAEAKCVCSTTGGLIKDIPVCDTYAPLRKGGICFKCCHLAACHATAKEKVDD